MQPPAQPQQHQGQEGTGFSPQCHRTAAPFPGIRGSLSPPSQQPAWPAPVTFPGQAGSTLLPGHACHCEGQLRESSTPGAPPPVSTPSHASSRWLAGGAAPAAPGTQQEGRPRTPRHACGHLALSRPRTASPGDPRGPGQTPAGHAPAGEAGAQTRSAGRPECPGDPLRGRAGQ